jgi:hypothetical protein
MRFSQILVFYICAGLTKGFLVRLVPESLGLFVRWWCRTYWQDCFTA